MTTDIKELLHKAHSAICDGNSMQALDLITEAGDQLSAQTAVEDMPIAQEPKYGIRDNRLYNRHSLEIIPPDEPVFIFRARDKKAVLAILAYVDYCQDVGHKRAILNRIEHFADFSRNHPERMKEPDTATHPAKTEQPSLSDAWDRLRSALDDHYKASYRFGEGTNRPDYDDAKRSERVIIDLFSALLSAQRQDSNKDALEVVHKFLLGEGPLDGFHFGDSDTARPRPAFWWRNFLRAAIANGAPK